MIYLEVRWLIEDGKERLERLHEFAVFSIEETFQ